MTSVSIETQCGTISDHFQFAVVPRVGEVVFIQTEAAEIKLRVLQVEHYPPAKGDLPDAISPVTIQCEVV
jgi:hypothetical protein